MPTGLCFPSAGTGFTPTSGFPLGYSGADAGGYNNAEMGAQGFSQSTETETVVASSSSTFATGCTPSAAYPPSGFLHNRRCGSVGCSGGTSSSEHEYTGCEGGSSMSSGAMSSKVHLPSYVGSFLVSYRPRPNWFLLFPSFFIV